MATPDSNPASLGFSDAARLVAAQYAAGTDLDQLAARHDDITASLLADAQTPDGRVYAREFSDTSASLIADLRADAAAARHQPEPGGTPHPDPRLAARGWQRCADDCGVYVRRQAQASRDIEREAG
jgi:hypothetical protein